MTSPFGSGAPDPPRLDLERLLERRLVIVSGCVDEAAATEISATLMTLDGISEEQVDLRLGSSGGTLTAAMMLSDTLDAMRARVTAVATGGLTGPAAVVLAVADERVITPTTVVTTTLVGTDLGSITASDAAIAADAHDRQLDAFTARLAATTSVSASDWRSRFEHGSVLTPDDAVAIGLADRVGFR